MSHSSDSHPASDGLSEIETLKRQIDELQTRLARSEKIKKTLMERVERSIESSGNAYTLFERNILLEQSIRQRTAALKESETAYRSLFEQSRLNEQRLDTLFQLNQMADEPLHVLSQFAMEEAVRLTGSTIGYLAFVSEDEKVLTMHAWSRSAMQECRIEDKPIIYPVESTGLWGEAIRQRKPVITNDYAQPNPHKKGCPQGHVAVHRHMNAPIFDGSRIVIVAGVGNKPTDYDETEVRQLTLLMQGMWSIVQRKRTEDTLRQNLDRSQNQQEVISRIAVSSDIADGNLEQVAKQITEQICTTVQVQRAGVWLFTEDSSELRCQDLYETPSHQHSSGVVLHRRQFEKEFATLDKAKYIDAHDVVTDPRTAGYAETYLNPLGITSMLDAGIRVGGRNLGVLCIEHVGTPRRWNYDEIVFACQLADQIALTILNHRRRQDQQTLRESTDYFNAIFQNVSAGILLIDPSTHTIVDVNPIAAELCGTTVRAMRGKICHQFICPAEIGKCPITDLGQAVDQSERIMVHCSGRRIPILKSIQPVHIGGRDLLLESFVDISDRKRMEESLRRSEQRYRSIVEHINDALYMHDFDGILLDVNDNTCSLLGYTREELIGSHLSCFDGPENARHIPERMKSLMETGILVFDGEHLRKDGTLVPTSVSARVVSREGRGIVQSFLRDITERKRAEEILRIERQRLASIIEGTNVGTWEWNVQTGETIFNERWAEIVGFRLEELEPISVTTWQNLAHPDDLKISQELIEKHFAGILDYYDCECRMKHKDGSWVWVHDRGKVIERTEDGKPLRMCGTHSDITTRKRAEEALRESEQKARGFLDSSFGFIGLLAPDGTVLEINKTALDFAGITMADVQGERFWNTVWWSHSLEMQDLIRMSVKSAAEGKLIRGEATHPAQDGTFHTIDFTLKPVPDDTGRIVRLIAEGHDITERKQAEENLRKAMEAANAANVAKSRFLANMSHEIRTPMNAILGFAELLTQETLSAEQADFVKTIRNSGVHLLSLINDILDFSKIEAGKMQLDIADCSLVEILNHMESLMTPFAAEKGLRFEVREQTVLPPVIRTDPIRLRQCLTNLVNNAIKFTDTGHVLVRTALTQTDGKPFIRFDIEDTGPGIPAEVQDKIFEAFEQADGSTTRKYGGTGLGLTITRHLTELLGGKLSLTSEPGKGTIFTIEIPANIDIQNQTAQNRRNFPILQDREHTLPDRFEGHVLVAEDVRTNQVLIRILLEQLGLRTTIVDNGQSAIEQVLSKAFDLIIMDMQMPTLNGFDAARQLRKRGIQTPIVALTAGAIKGDQQKCLAAGCDEYLAKPIDRKQLIAVLAKYLTAVKPVPQTS